MNGIIITKGPQNWRILQQKDGYADVKLEGVISLENTVFEYPDWHIIIRVVDEISNARILSPIKIKPDSEAWSASFRIPTGGPYRIETLFRFNHNWEKRGDRILHLGVGEVFVIAGQSNAMGVGKDNIIEEPSLDVHMFRYSGNWDIATHPLNDATASKFPLTVEGGQVGNSPWLAFAKKLNKALGYPIGLIPAAVGGIPLANWNREENGKHFNNMLEIVKASGSEIRGVLWYQGCNDADSGLGNTYFERFKKVVEDFEKEFYKGIPIFTVQLNKIICTKEMDEIKRAENYSEVRAAQLRAKNEIENVYIVPSIDCMVCDGIHNTSGACVVIGERVANTALKYIYGKEVICDSPEIIGAYKENSNRVRLEFNNVYDCIFSDLNRTETLMFRVTDKNGKMSPADYECNGGNTMTLIFDRDIEGEAYIDCSGYNEASLMPYDLYSYLPVIPFGKIVIVERK